MQFLGRGSIIKMVLVNGCLNLKQQEGKDMLNMLFMRSIKKSKHTRIFKRKDLPEKDLDLKTDRIGLRKHTRFHSALCCPFHERTRAPL